MYIELNKFNRVTHSLNSITNKFTSIKNFTTFFSNGNIQNYIYHQLQKMHIFFKSTNNQHFFSKVRKQHSFKFLYFKWKQTHYSVKIIDLFLSSFQCRTKVFGCVKQIAIIYICTGDKRQ